MIGTTGLKRKSSSSINASTTLTNSINPISTLNKKFRGTAFDGSQQNNGSNKSLQSNSMKSDASSMINGGETVKSYKRLDESDLTPQMLTEYRRLQHELQCQEALLVLMQKLKSNQRLISQNNHQNNGVKQRATATKLNQQQPQPQPTSVDGKTPLTATKQSQSQLTNNVNRSTPNKTPHPNQYTVNRTNTNSQNLSHSSSKTTLSSQATRQSNTNSTGNNLTNSLTTSNSATRLSSTTVPNSATKTSAVPSTNTGSSSSSNGTSSKSNGAAAEQHLLNAKLALRKQLEQTLLQIPTPKPTTCDLTFIPGVNGWSEFLAYLGLEQAFNTYSDIVNRRPPTDISMTLPYVCAQCGTDWSVTWHEISSTTENNSIEEKILCDRCTKTSQKKLLKQDHSNRLRQAFIKALQQEKELDAKFQSQSTSSSTPSSSSSGNNSSNNTTTNTSTTSVAVKTSSSSPSLSSSKHVHSSSSSNKHSSKPLSTKTSSNHHHHHHHHNSTSNNHNHHHHHHHSSSSSKTSSSSKSHHNATSTIPPLTPSPADALASTLAAFQTPEQMELFQKHFLSTMLPFAAVANQAAAAAALTAKSSQQQQQALAAFPAMAASLMRQPNPAQYLLDMIPQAAKQQQQQQQQSQHHHHHSK